MAQRDDIIPSSSTRLIVPCTILFVLLSVAVVRSPALISSSGVGSMVIVVAPLILATYALTIIVMAGRGGIDLSIGPLIGFINVGLIKAVEFGYLESPIAVFLYAMIVGVVYQLLMGLIIVYVRVQPIIVSLSGYLALVGLNLLIFPRPGGIAPEWMQTWGSGTSILSPVLFIVIVATIAWYLVAQTAFFSHLRLMGSDERAAYSSGVNVNIVRLGAHCIGGVFAGLAAICFTALISSGDPTQGTTFTLMAVTALVLGGANLSGGRGGAIGSLLGALNIYLITYLLATFDLGTMQSYVTDLSYGSMLVISLLISIAIPQIQLVTRYLSPSVFFAVLATIGGGIVLHATIDAPVRLAAAFAEEPVVPETGAVALSAGTVFILVIIGIVAFAYLVRLLVRKPGIATVALAAVILVVAAGLTFHSRGIARDAAPDRASVSLLTGSGFDYFSMEGEPRITESGEITSPVISFAYGVLLSLGVILLVSIIILLNLRDAKMLPPETLRLILLGAIGLAVLALVSILAAAGSEDSSLFGVEGLTVVAVAAGLFVLMWSPMQFRVGNIANAYILTAGLLAFGSLYFSPLEGANLRASDEVGRVAPFEFRKPVKAGYDFTVRPPVAELAEVKGALPVANVAGPAANFIQISYSILLILALHLALWAAMTGRKLRDAVPFGHTIVGSILAWTALFCAAGAALANILVVLVVATVTAPLVWWLFDSYGSTPKRQRKQYFMTDFTEGALP